MLNSNALSPYYLSRPKDDIIQWVYPLTSFVSLLIIIVPIYHNTHNLIKLNLLRVCVCTVEKYKYFKHIIYSRDELGEDIWCLLMCQREKVRLLFFSFFVTTERELHTIALSVCVTLCKIFQTIIVSVYFHTHANSIILVLNYVSSWICLSALSPPTAWAWTKEAPPAPFVSCFFGENPHAPTAAVAHYLFISSTRLKWIQLSFQLAQFLSCRVCICVCICLHFISSHEKVKTIEVLCRNHMGRSER